MPRHNHKFPCQSAPQATHRALGPTFASPDRPIEDVAAAAGFGPSLTNLAGESLRSVLRALADARADPALVFLQPSLVLGAGAARASGEDWEALSQFRSAAVRRGVPFAGVMLSADGVEVPHWVVPSLLAPVLGSENDVLMELPCWSTGCPHKASARPLLTLTMIVKNEARKIRETLQSVAKA